MDGDSANLGFLLARAEREISLLQNDARLSAPQGTRGAALYQHVLDLIGAVEHRLAAAPSAGASQVARRAFARTVRQAIVELQSAHRALPWLSATRRPHLNLGSLYVTEELARDLVGADVDLVVVPDPEYMYSTTSWPFRGYIDGVHGFSAQNTRRPIVLNFPLTDAHRVFLHPIFAHELGHSSVDEHDLADQAIAILKSDANYSTERQAALAAVQAQVPAADVSEIEDAIDEMLDSWCTEVLCDALGLEIAGVAFLYALAAFLMPLGYAEPGSEHPPNTMRMNLALEQLRERWWEPSLRVTPNIVGWFDSVAADAGSPLEHPSRFLRDMIMAHASDFRQLAAGRVGTSSLDPAGCLETAKKAAELLELDIIPLENNDRLERRGILTGGWHRAFAKHTDSPAGLVAAIGDDDLQELVGKALELSTVVDAWEQP